MCLNEHEENRVGRNKDFGSVPWQRFRAVARSKAREHARREESTAAQSGVRIEIIYRHVGTPRRFAPPLRNVAHYRASRPNREERYLASGPLICLDYDYKSITRGKNVSGCTYARVRLRVLPPSWIVRTRRRLSRQLIPAPYQAPLQRCGPVFSSFFSAGQQDNTAWERATAARVGGRGLCKSLRLRFDA